MKPGTRVVVEGVVKDTGKIVRWNRAVNGPRMDGWHIVKFDIDAATLCVHESRFSVLEAA